MNEKQLLQKTLLIQMLKTMSFIKVNLVLKTDKPTDLQTDRQTNLGIETTCSRLKIIT